VEFGERIFPLFATSTAKALARQHLSNELREIGLVIDDQGTAPGDLG
jgi:hypothetical protein